MRQLEYFFNRRHKYPWVFFSELPFSEEFRVGALDSCLFLASIDHDTGRNIERNLC